MPKEILLRDVIYRTLLRTSLVPILTIELVLVVIYFGLNYYNLVKNHTIFLESTKREIRLNAKNLADKIGLEFEIVEERVDFLRSEHEQFFNATAKNDAINNNTT
jgi:tetrahydromethanopterin S-methyltransferase subunit H